MCYLDIHPAHILLAFFWLHPSVLGNLAPNSTCPPLGNWTRRLQNTKWTGCLVEPLAGSSRPQELFRNWRSGPLVIPRTGSVRAHARKTHAGAHFYSLETNTNWLSANKHPHLSNRIENFHFAECPPTFEVIWKNPTVYIFGQQRHDKCGAGDQSNCSREWCHGRCCEPAGRGLGYS